MSRVLGTVTFPGGTGSKAVTVGIAATWCHVVVGGALGGDTFYRHSEGWSNGTSSQFTISAEGNTVSDPQSGKIIQWKDNTGVVVFEATVSAYSSTQITFNVTTAPSTMPQIILEAGN